MIRTSHGALPQGPICDLVTPFFAGHVDEAVLAWLVDRQVESGMAGLLVCGPTGEPWSLDDAERAAAIGVAVAAADGRAPVLAGTGTNDTERTIRLTADAKSLGATAAYVVMPYYSKPSQEGIFRHYEAICLRVDLPIVVGLHPQRTGVDLAPWTLERLGGLAGIVAIDDATAAPGRMGTAPVALRRRIAFYAGHEPSAAAFRLAGGQGWISAAANLVPDAIVAVDSAIDKGELATVRMLAERLQPLLQALECESIPPAIKYGLNLMHGTTADVRLPMTPVAAETGAAIRMALAPLVDRIGHKRAAAGQGSR